MKNSVVNYVRSHPKQVFWFGFVLLSCYQLLFVSCGIELCDTGFYMTFYEHIFTDPECVEYNFMYYFSGVVGGGFLALFPTGGLLGLRLLGVIANMLTVYLVYRLFNKKLTSSEILIGSSLVVLTYIAMPTTFYNDLLSCLLFLAASLFLYKGVKNTNFLFLALSGLFIALNAFARLPNVLDLGLVSLIIIYKIMNQQTVKTCLLSILSLIGGFLVSTLLVLLLMRLIGHYDPFMNTLSELKRIFESGSSSHGLPNLVMANLRNYKTLVQFSFIFYLLLGGFILSKRYVRTKLLLYPLLACWLLADAYWLYVSSPLVVICSVSLFTLLYIVIWNKCAKEMKFFAWLALFMLLVMPVGSDGGMYNTGSILCWLATPIVVHFFSTRQSSKLFMTYSLCLFSLLCVGKMLTSGCYFDDGSLFEKRYAIHSDKAKYIYTSQERADIINDALAGIQPYLKEGDYLFTFGSIPMMNYLTGTKPYLQNSWPELFSKETLARKLALNAQADSLLPLLLRHKFSTIGSHFGAPSEQYLVDCGEESGYFASNEKMKVVNDFIEQYHYVPIWENDYFVLYKANLYCKLLIMSD